MYLNLDLLYNVFSFLEVEYYTSNYYSGLGYALTFNNGICHFDDYGHIHLDKNPLWETISKKHYFKTKPFKLYRKIYYNLIKM